MHWNLQRLVQALEHYRPEPLENCSTSLVIPRIFITLLIALASAGFCHVARDVVIPGWPGDFTWALDTARDLVAGRDPYAPYLRTLPPSRYPAPVPYPLPVALFGLPLLWLPPLTASVVFCGVSAALLAYGIMRSGNPWRLLVFLTFPFLHALAFAQWSPLVMAAWYFRFMAPLLVLAKPQAALPVAINRSTWAGTLTAAVVLAASLAIYPWWPWRWIRTIHDYQHTIPALQLPLGPLLLLAGLRWRSARARLLLAMSVLPVRGAYDLLPLWLVPASLLQMLLLVILSWVEVSVSHHASMSAEWIIPALYIPALAMTLWSTRVTSNEMLQHSPEPRE